MSTTRTGGFGIGFRRGGRPWQQNLAALIDWAKDHGFECIDVRGADVVQQIVDAGLAVGSADLLDGRNLISPDKAKRDEAVAANVEYLEACAGKVRNFFCVMLPEDRERPRAENFGCMVESFAQLTDALEAAGGRVVIEGWPGPGALCCTPETLRAFFQEVPSPAMGVNYDPSHLIRMGIEPVRFLQEFAARVGHVHGKDTELLAERRYELGTEQPATFAEGIPFGGTHWRYTIPGHGQMRWIKAFEVLAAAGYDGFVSVELEDANFNGSEDGEKRGLLLAKAFLEGC